jgi:dienelactone hydrolase
MRNPLCVAAALFLRHPAASAEVKTRTIEYKDEQTTLRGYLAWDDSTEGRRPAVLVVHEWWGLNNYARGRAEQLAKMGYVAFAVDMYGEGKVTKHPKEAGQWAGEHRRNTDAWVRRAKAGLKVLQDQPQTDTERVAAIGYCFGGSTVLQLAYAGADLKGVVSFHGSLTPSTPEQGKNIKAKILVCHGAADTFIPEEQVHQFRAALDQAGADYQMIYYANATHSFTNPEADKSGVEGLKYNPAADRRSWRHMKTFFDEIFANK